MKAARRSRLGAARLTSWVQRFSVWVGTVSTWVLLVPLYYTFFTLFRLAFRRGRRDAMQRWWDPQADSYWSPLPQRPGADSYERQF